MLSRRIQAMQSVHIQEIGWYLENIMIGLEIVETDLVVVYRDGLNYTSVGRAI